MSIVTGVLFLYAGVRDTGASESAVWIALGLLFLAAHAAARAKRTGKI